MVFEVVPGFFVGKSQGQGLLRVTRFVHDFFAKKNPVEESGISQISCPPKSLVVIFCE